MALSRARLSAAASRLNQKLREGDLVNAARRRGFEIVDLAIGEVVRRWKPRFPPEPFDGDVRFGLVIVNFSTTDMLKALLRSLAEQQGFPRVRRIVIVDNGSRDGGIPYLRRLAALVPRLTLIERRHLLDHALGLRAGVRALGRAERSIAAEESCNVLIFCDPDVLFRAPTALSHLAQLFEGDTAVLAGEWRGDRRDPDIQASFLAVRRDVYELGTTDRPMSGGSPTRRLQRSIARRPDMNVVDFPSNFGGYILHRGRSAVQAASEHHPSSPYATVRAESHFMGVPGGAEIWDHLVDRFSGPALDVPEALAARLNTSFETPRGDPSPAPSGVPDQRAPYRWDGGLLSRATPEYVVVMRPLDASPAILSGTARLCWDIFQEPTSGGAAAQLVADVLGVAPEAVWSDLADFQAAMIGAGLLVEAGATRGDRVQPPISRPES